MSFTIAQARDEITKLFEDGWKAAFPTYPYAFDDVAFSPPASDVIWARLTVRHVTGTQATLAAVGGVRRWERAGLATVQVFAPTGKGLKFSDEAVNVVERIFRGVSTSNGIWFRNVRINEVGRDGAWWQTNVLAEFMYDEIS